MSNILQYAPWCKIYIITERPWEGIKKAKATTEAVQRGIKTLMKLHGEGQHTISQEELNDIFSTGAERKVYNVSKDIITGQVNLTINQAHSMGFTLANPDGKYTNLFMSMDRVVLFLKRVKVVQAFSGFLDGVPVKTMRKSQPVSLTATCTMKRLINTYWNPYIHFGRDWVDPGILPEEYLHYLLEEVGGWDKKDVFIQPFHDIEFWNQLAEYSIQAPAASITIDTNATGTGGGASPGGTELTTGDACLPDKLDDFLRQRNSPMAGGGQYFVKYGKQYKVNPGLIVAMGGSETSYGTASQGCNKHGSDYNFWGIKWADRFAQFGASVGPKSPEGDHYCKFSSMEAAAHTCADLLATYLTPGTNRYCDGTIRGISGMWTKGSCTPNEAWTERATTAYNLIMQQCANPNSGIGQTSPSRNHDTSRLDSDNPNYQPPSDPQTPQEEQAALRGRGGGVGATSGNNVYHGFPVSANATYVGGTYVYDRDGGRFGDPRTGHMHKGVDVMVDPGTPFYAVIDGTVTELTPQIPGGGNMLKLTAVDGSGDFFYYMHNQSHNKEVIGKQVKAGTLLGYVDNTGFSNKSASWSHIHFEYHPKGGAAIDPMPFLKGHDPALGAPGYDRTGASSGSQLVQDGLNTMLYDLLGYKAPGELEVIKGVYQLAVQQRLLDHVLKAAQFGLYVCNTDGTGRFIARWADYFGEEPDAKGNSGPHFSIEDIEIKTGSVQVNDMNMVTHQFVIGDSARDGNIDVADWKKANFYDENGQATGEFGIAVTAFNSERLGILNESEWTAEEFIERFGYRPSVKEEMLISNVAQAQYYSEYLFRTKWANCVTGNLQTTFLPEVRPMMVVKIPSWRMQFYVQSVTHTFGTRFGSSFSLIAGAFLDDSLGSRNPMLAKINSSPIGDNYNLAIGEADAISPGSGTAKIFGPESGKSPFSWFNPISGHSPY